MSTILSGGRIALEDSILDPGSLVLDDGVIADVRAGAIDRTGGDWHDVRGHLLVPGFIDVHVHGVEGIDTLATADAVAKLAARFPRYGVTGFCPTTVGCPPLALRRLLDGIRKARIDNLPGHAAVYPAHLESNFINPDFRGAQPLDWPSGMLDAYLAVNCNRDPRDGLLDVFTEDNMNGRLIWYRVDDSDIETLQGTLVVQAAAGEQ